MSGMFTRIGGEYGSVPVPMGLPLEPHARWSLHYEDLNLPAGSSDVLLYTVLTDQLLYIDYLAFAYENGTPPTQFWIDLSTVGGGVRLFSAFPVPAREYHHVPLRVLLTGGDDINLHVRSATAGEDVFVSLWGRIIMLVQ